MYTRELIKIILKEIWFLFRLIIIILASILLSIHTTELLGFTNYYYWIVAIYLFFIFGGIGVKLGNAKEKLEELEDDIYDLEYIFGDKQDNELKELFPKGEYDEN